MMNKVKKMRAGNISVEQKRKLLEFVKCNKKLVEGKFDKQFSFKTAQGLWKAIANELNSIPGGKKEWKQWRKTWQDLKTNAKLKKIRTNRKGGLDEIIEENIFSPTDTTSVEAIHNSEESAELFDVKEEVQDEEYEELSPSDYVQDNFFYDKNFNPEVHNQLNDPSKSVKMEEEINSLICTQGFSNSPQISSVCDKETTQNTVFEINKLIEAGTNTCDEILDAIHDVPVRNRKKRVPARRRRLRHNTIIGEKLNIKKEYYAKKLELLERGVMAKEAISEKLDRLLQIINNKLN